MEATKETQQLIAALKTNGRTKAWAARECGCTYPHFHDVLSGRRNLSDDLRKKIIGLLGKLASPLAG